MDPELPSNLELRMIIHFRSKCVLNWQPYLNIVRGRWNANSQELHYCACRHSNATWNLKLLVGGSKSRQDSIKSPWLS